MDKFGHRFEEVVLKADVDRNGPVNNDFIQIFVPVELQPERHEAAVLELDELLVKHLVGFVALRGAFGVARDLELEGDGADGADPAVA